MRAVDSILPCTPSQCMDSNSKLFQSHRRFWECNFAAMMEVDLKSKMIELGQNNFIYRKFLDSSCSNILVATGIKVIGIERYSSQMLEK